MRRDLCAIRALCELCYLSLCSAGGLRAYGLSMFIVIKSGSAIEHDIK